MMRGWLLIALLAFGSVHAAAPKKVVRDIIPVAETGFDPAATSDLYSAAILQAVFERLYTYDYLARPAKVVPMLAETMPVITDDGRTYTIPIRRGVYFAADPAFGGKPRELTADDFVYSLKRVMDPKIRSPWGFLLEGKLVGVDEEAAAATKSGRFDYDKKIAGIEAVDRYTLRLRLKAPDYNLPYVLAHESTSAVAREVIAKYAETDGRAMSNPVGTGPYVLSEWIRSSKIVLEANPGFRDMKWNWTAQEPGDEKIVAQMQGKKLPVVDRVEVYVMEEDQARWLAFRNGEVDLMNMEGPLAPNAIEGRQAAPGARREGRAAAAHRRPRDQLHLLEHAGPGHRRIHQGKDRVASRAGHVL